VILADQIAIQQSTKQYVSIRHVYLDRGFYQVNVVTELEQQNVDLHRACASE
jgi:ABC-type transporter lipoprotein component MlaA